MTVADKDSLCIAHPLFAVRRIVTIESSVVLPSAFKGSRKFAGGAVVPKQDLRQRRTPFLSRVPSMYEARHTIDPSGHVDVSARGDHNNRIPVYARDLLDKLILPCRKLERAVCSFAFGQRIKAHAQNYHVRPLRQLFGFASERQSRRGDAKTYGSRTHTFKVLETDLVRFS